MHIKQTTAFSSQLLWVQNQGHQPPPPTLLPRKPVNQKENRNIWDDSIVRRHNRVIKLLLTVFFSWCVSSFQKLDWRKIRLTQNYKNKHKIAPSYWGEGTHHNSDLHFNIQGTPTCPLLVCHLCLKNCWLDDPDIMKQSRQMEFLFFYPVADAMMPHVGSAKKALSVC